MFFKKTVSLFLILILLMSAVLPVFAEEDLVIVLDPGHGANDMGSEGKLNGKTIYEKDLNNTVANHLYESLSQYKGVKVYLTRYDDSSMSLCTRATMAGDLKADLMISLHMNSLENAAYWGGTEIFIHTGNYLSEGEKATRAIAENILNGFEKYGLKKRGIKTRLTDEDYTYPNGAPSDYYGIIRYATAVNVPAMIIEHGFMSNQSDLAFLSKSENLKKLADETANAVATYYKLEKGAGQKMTLISQPDELIIGNLPTTLTVGDEITSLTASGGSGSGKIYFETNDNSVIRIKGDKLIAVGEGKANITAVRSTDGVYQAKKSDNYIRITVNKAPVPTETAAPTQAPTLAPTSVPTQVPTQPAVSTPSAQISPTVSVSAASSDATAKVSGNTDSTSGNFWTAVLICVGVLVVFLIISIVLLIKSSKNTRR